MISELMTDDGHENLPALNWLVWFLRILSIVYIGATLFYWTRIFGIALIDEATGFLDLVIQKRVMTVFFAVLTPAVSVGLWLCAAWGTVTWLMTVLTHVVVYVFFSSVFGMNSVLLLFHAVCVTIFGVLIFRLARQRAQAAER